MTTRSQLRQTPVGLTCATVAAVAHELRLPLSHIKGFVSALRRTDVEWDPQTRQEFLAEVELEADRLADLVDSLVDAGRYSDVGSRHDGVERTTVADMVDGAVHRVRGLLGDRVVRRDVSTDLPSVQVNVGQMERVLANLVQNAVKYTPPGSPIDIVARTTPEDELHLAVADRGPGVPLSHQKEIFQPFFRSQHTNASATPGSGLGLAICQSIVLAHGGRIAVSDRRGGGAMFSVFLPLMALKEVGHDPANDSRGRRRNSDAKTPVRQSQSQRLRGSRRRRWQRGLETDRGASVRSPAA